MSIFEAWTKDGKKKQETADLSKLELQHLTIKELLQRILLEQIRTNLHLESMTDEQILDADLERRTSI
jgi:hypothetical protein